MRIGINLDCWISALYPMEEPCSLEQCFSEAKLIGYQGVAWNLPQAPCRTTRSLLIERDLELAVGWHYVDSQRSPHEEENSFLERLEGYRSFGCHTLALCDRSLFHSSNSFSFCDDKRRWYTAFEHYAVEARRHGMKLVYIPHWGAMVQTRHDIDELMACTKYLGLAFHPAFLEAIGESSWGILKEHFERIQLVLAMDLKPEVLPYIDFRSASYRHCLDQQLFTVPGEGSLDFVRLISQLNTMGYSHWALVFSQQNPSTAHSFSVARLGYTTLRHCIVRSRLQKANNVRVEEIKDKIQLHSKV